MDLQNSYLIQPFPTGKEKRSLAMIFPSPVVKMLKFDPLTMFLLLKVHGADNIQLTLIRKSDLIKKKSKNSKPVEQLTTSGQQAILGGE